MRNPIVDTQRISQFVAVAESSSIARAATELHLSQQAVSSTIKTLERNLDVVLFKREGRQMFLTPAGTKLLEGAKPLLDASNSLARATRTAARGGDQQFVVGYSPEVSSDEILAVTDSICRTLPQSSVVARQLFAGEMPSALRSGSIDVGLRLGANPPDDMASAVVAYTPLRVAVASSHRYAKRSVIVLPELANDKLILSETPGKSPYADFLLSVCRQSGFDPQITMNRIRGTAPTTAVIGTDYFTFVHADPGDHHRGKTSVLLVDGDPVAPLRAIWLLHTASQLHQLFLRTPSLESA